MKDTITFGEFIRKVRQRNRITARTAADAAGMLPSNFSKMEHGLLNPPKDAERQKALAAAISLEEAELSIFFDLAAKAANSIPVDIAEIISEQEAVPLLLRTIGNKRLDPATVKRLVQIVRGNSGGNQAL